MVPQDGAKVTRTLTESIKAFMRIENSSCCFVFVYKISEN